MVTTEGHLLGGRIRYRQPDTGFRSGLEPVLLAASVPARPGEHVLEAGTGAGAA
jgi:tRNA1Val (adenine37-N6)-methyltransferase